MHSFATALGALRAPIVISALSVAVVMLPLQSREVFIAIGEAERLQLLWEAGRALFCLLLFSAVVLVGCIVLLSKPAASRREAVQEYRRFLQALSATLALLPFASILAALMIEPETNQKWAGFIQGLFAIGLTGVVVILVRYDRATGTVVKWGMCAAAPFARLSALQGVLALAALIAVLIACIVKWPKPFSDLIGPVGVIFLFFQY